MPKASLSIGASGAQVPDVSPTITYIYQSDFSEDTDGWSVGVIGNVRGTAGQTVGGEDDCLSIQGLASAFNYAGVSQKTAPTMTAGTRYYASVKVYLESGFDATAYIVLGSGNDRITMWTNATYDSVPTEEWVTYSTNFVLGTPPSNWSINTNSDTTLTTGDVLAIKDLKVYTIT